MAVQAVVANAFDIEADRSLGVQGQPAIQREFSTGKGYTEKTLSQGRQMDFEEFHLLRCFLRN